jgi:biopolymer transport protein ExbB
MLYSVLLVAKEPTQINLFTIAVKGGFLMLVLLLISIVAIAIIINRIQVLKKSKNDDEDLVNKINQQLKVRGVEQVLGSEELQNDIPIANVIRKALEHYQGSWIEIREVIESAVKHEVHSLERYLGTLATFAAIAPLIGFLGTVTGMVKVFMKIGETGGGVDISLLAGGIWEALITTIGGLSVGIITILFYNYLVGKIENLAQQLEDETNDFIFALRRLKDEN